MKTYKRSKFKIIARQVAHEAVRNTFLEELHCGIFPGGKDKDIKVYCRQGEIPWEKVSRISDEEMRKLMLEIENNLRISLWYWFGVGHHKKDDLLKACENTFFGKYGISWDNPEWGKHDH